MRASVDVGIWGQVADGAVEEELAAIECWEWSVYRCHVNLATFEARKFVISTCEFPTSVVPVRYEMTEHLPKYENDLPGHVHAGNFFPVFRLLTGKNFPILLV
jgi:hypothetical protein